MQQNDTTGEFYIYRMLPPIDTVHFFFSYENKNQIELLVNKRLPAMKLKPEDYHFSAQAKHHLYKSNNLPAWINFLKLDNSRGD